MTDYTKLVEALRHCSHDGLVKCNECKYGGKEWPVGCEEEMMADAADAIEELKDKPWVESVQIDKLQQRIDELEEKQTYCDAYGNKWMTSGKDVPTEAYRHGYADGWDEAMAKMEVQDGK